MFLVDEDPRAFNKIIDAFGFSKGTDAEKEARLEGIEEASKYTMKIPLRVIKKSLESMEVMKTRAGFENPNSVSDAGVGALCARTAVRGAGLNVRINASGLKIRSL